MIIEDFKIPGDGLIPIIVVKVGNKKLYGVEGFIPSTGIVLDWFIKNQFIDDYNEICKNYKSSENILFFPFFRGSRSPKYTGNTATILGLKLDNETKDIVASFIESIGFLVNEILTKMFKKFSSSTELIYCNGGLSQCNSLLQSISNYSGLPIIRQRTYDATAFGVLKLLRVSSGKIGFDDITPSEGDIMFTPQYNDEERIKKIEKWRKMMNKVVRWGI
jgi:glycerol kinase